MENFCYFPYFKLNTHNYTFRGRKRKLTLLSVLQAEHAQLHVHVEAGKGKLTLLSVYFRLNTHNQLHVHVEAGNGKLSLISGLQA